MTFIEEYPHPRSRVQPHPSTRYLWPYFIGVPRFLPRTQEYYDTLDTWFDDAIESMAKMVSQKGYGLSIDDIVSVQPMAGPTIWWDTVSSLEKEKK